ADLLCEQLLLGVVFHAAEEKLFAEEIRKTFFTDEIPGLEVARLIRGMEEGVSYGSSDVGDVSWVVPTGGFNTATFVPGSPAHSWQSTACAGHSIGRKGMVVAAKTLALSTMDLMNDPKLIEDARKSFGKRKGTGVYRSRLPDDQKPPLDYRRDGR
ncbi:MAG: amidohydrolase, partial [Chthoniobacteraceae bacterium]